MPLAPYNGRNVGDVMAYLCPTRLQDIGYLTDFISG